MLVVEHMTSLSSLSLLHRPHACLLAAMPSAMMNSYPSQTVSPSKFFPPQSLLVLVFYHSNRNLLTQHMIRAMDLELACSEPVMCFL